jgi:predicted SAM-dependent methyltransferase
LKSVLDLGCGNRKKPGAIGVDINPNAQADIIHDLNKFPYPFEDSTFDEIYADNTIEHLENIICVMEEIHRISKADASIQIIVPYFRARWAYIDPTHKHFFTIGSFTYFDPEHVHSKLYNYSQAKFKTERIVFNEYIQHQGMLKYYYRLLKTFAEKWPVQYETHLSSVFPLDTITFYLKTIK